MRAARGAKAMVTALTPLALCGPVVLQACGPPEEPVARTAVRDSAGIRVVENSSAPGVDREGWRIHAEPSLSIGGGEREDDQLFQVRGVIWLRGGRIAIANAGSLEIRIHDATGSLLRTIGGSGRGPGEFLSIEYLGSYGADTLVVLDYLQRRISYVHLEDGFLRSAPVDLEVGLSLLTWGNLPDGRLLIGGGATAASVAQLRNGLNRTPSDFTVAAVDGSLDFVLAEVAGGEVFAQGVGTDLELWRVPFAKRPVAAVSRDRLYTGSADRYEIHGWDPDGTLALIIRLEQEPRPVTPEDIERFIAMSVAESPDDEAELRRVLGRMPRLETMPAHGRFLADTQGCLWVEEYRPPFETGPAVWTVFDADGAVRGRLEAPAGVQLMSVGDDRVMGVFRDSLDVESVRMHRLERPVGRSDR